jgi:hypothetical protein
MEDITQAQGQDVAVVPVVVVHLDIHHVLTVCGFANKNQHTHIINNEDFQLVADFGLLDGEKDMFEMVRHLVGHTTDAAGCVYVGTILVKKLQALCYWVHDHQKHGQAINHNDWDEAAGQETIEMMHIKKGRDTDNVSVSDLGKFNPEDFEMYKMAFIDLLVQTYDANKESLRYIVGVSVAPVAFVNKAKRHMFQLPLSDGAYEEDNKVVYHLLKSFLVNTAGWTWIEGFDMAED